MPMIFEPDAFELWLAANAEPAAIKAMLKPYDGPLITVSVSARVNNVHNGDPYCIAPIAA